MVFSLFAVLFESRLCRFLLRPVAAVLPLAALVSGMGWNAVDARAQAAAAVTMNIAVNKPGIQVSPTLWGIFFEEINYAGEGGLWGQLVNNPTLKALGANGQPVGWSLANGTRKSHPTTLASFNWPADYCGIAASIDTPF